MTKPCLGHAAESAWAEHLKEAERLIDDLVRAGTAGDEHGTQCHCAYFDIRAALLAHIQRGAVPEGERAAFESWIENEAGAGASRRWLNTEAYENGRVQDYRTGWIACLEWLAAAAAVPAPAEVLMPKPVAYGFGNTAITGHTNRLMMVRIDIPGGDQYAGAFWLPLVLAEEARTYGAACRAAGEAAGYARVLEWAVSRWKDEVENRPLENKNRRPLDDVWRQVVRFAGGDPDALLGPSHDAALRGEVN